MDLPPLPKIDGDTDIILDVYTHRSLRPNLVMNDDYGDTDRLAEFGDRILRLAVTYHYFSKRPMLQANEIRERSESALSNERLQGWLESYGLISKLRWAPGTDVVNSPDVRPSITTHSGAILISHQRKSNWISQLIDPAEKGIPPPHQWAPEASCIPPPQPAWNLAAQPPQPPQPSQPSSPPPPLPSEYLTTISAPSSNLVTLALVNQTAVQRGVTLEYSAGHVGPPHQPTWTVRCLVNGAEQGRGVGKSQKLAKEEAARQAWVRMGW
ncbi:hypothetical protein H0H87_012422 [Tephrocybe sp. NHM501043]|nr:hypothetical protein H0H87_012422 [Tephrocybe sp. NHM501043]